MLEATVQARIHTPTFAFRGGIVSTTGYACTVRALAEILAEYHCVPEVSIHEGSTDRSADFPAGLVGDAELSAEERHEYATAARYWAADPFLVADFDTRLCAASKPELR